VSRFDLNRSNNVKKVTAALVALTLVSTIPAFAQDGRMNFFITSAGPGDGANLGGLEGADQQCTDLAYAAGLGDDLLWQAYLSTIARSGMSAVNARDRIGSGPWYNYAGAMIARDVTHLHSEDVNLTKETQLNERGSIVNGRGDSPNMHDILTGSNLDGTSYGGGEGYTNCDNWTSNGEGSTRVGHHDRTGGGENPESWNSAHNSRGCSQENLQATGGNGFYYCFGLPDEQLDVEPGLPRE
jgi:hypothetical protein|tara:strand:+ start:355 stop:1077 length:723 start_codon:yes stop_codon:yes gene_type:complete